MMSATNNSNESAKCTELKRGSNEANMARC